MSGGSRRVNVARIKAQFIFMNSFGLTGSHSVHRHPARVVVQFSRDKLGENQMRSFAFTRVNHRLVRPLRCQFSRAQYTVNFVNLTILTRSANSQKKKKKKENSQSLKND